MDGPLRLRLMLAAGLFVAGGGAALAVLLRAVAGPSRARPQPRPAGAPWSGLHVLGAFVAILWLSNFLAVAGLSVLDSAGVLQARYGPDPPGAVRQLWARVLTFPLVLAAMIALPRAMRVADPFAGRGRVSAVVAGYLTWLIVTPAVYCVYVLASLGHLKLTGREPDRHPLTALGDAAGPLEWGLFFAETVLIAPLVEEWLFRGVLLPWLAQPRPVQPDAPLAVPPVRRPTLVLLLALAAAVTFTLGTDALARPDETRRALADPADAIGSYAIPAVFFLALIGLDRLLPRFERLRRHLRIRSRQQARAVLASAALFAAFHVNVWPSPIPLVLLAVALGYLYLRTRTLVGPIVVHGLFNAVPAAYLLLGGPP